VDPFIDLKRKASMEEEINKSTSIDSKLIFFTNEARVFVDTMLTTNNIMSDSKDALFIAPIKEQLKAKRTISTAQKV
jgi:hypothetical protein